MIRTAYLHQPALLPPLTCHPAPMRTSRPHNSGQLQGVSALTLTGLSPAGLMQLLWARQGEIIYLVFSGHIYKRKKYKNYYL